MPPAPTIWAAPVQSARAKVLAPAPPLRAAASNEKSDTDNPSVAVNVAFDREKFESLTAEIVSVPPSPSSEATPVQPPTAKVLSPTPPVRTANSIEASVSASPSLAVKALSAKVKFEFFTAEMRSVPPAPLIDAMPV